MIEIKKAKITKEQTLSVEYARLENSEVISENAEKFNNLIHPDLRAAFDKLAPHMALLCDLREGDCIGRAKGKFSIDEVPAERFSNINITNFSIGGDAEEGVTITGQKKLASGKILNLNSPFQKYGEEEESYQYASELMQAVNDCVFEVEEYISGKCAQKQISMEFENDTEEIIEPLKALKKTLKDNNVTMSVAS